MFTILHKDNLARTGIITTKHGEIRTPAFIPVATKGTIKSLTIEQFDSIGFDSFLCNTYHLFLQPGENVVENHGNLHNFTSYQKPIWTDSGGFQVFSLSDATTVTQDGVSFTSHIDASQQFIGPEESMRIQHTLGADIIFTFDECIHFADSYERTKQAMEQTHQWTLRCIEELKRLNSDQALFGIVQGGKFKDLREQSAKFISSLDFPGYGIGGIFGDPSKEIHDVVKHTMQFLPEDKPKHMLGIGSVEDLFEYVACGADTFDCVLPTRLARQGYVFFKGNKDNKFRYRVLAKKYEEDSTPLDSDCGCFVCKTHTKSYIRHLFKANEFTAYSLLTYHNLWFFCRLMEKMREAIKNNEFQALQKEWIY